MDLQQPETAQPSRSIPFIRILLSPPSWPLELLLAIFTYKITDALFQRDSGEEGMSGLFEQVWETIGQLPGNPIFQVGFIVWACLMFVWGIKRSERAASTALSKEREHIEEFKEFVRDRTMFPSLLLEKERLESKINQSGEDIADAQREIEKHRKWVEGLRGHDDISGLDWRDLANRHNCDVHKLLLKARTPGMADIPPQRAAGILNHSHQDNDLVSFRESPGWFSEQDQFIVDAKTYLKKCKDGWGGLQTKYYELEDAAIKAIKDYERTK